METTRMIYNNYERTASGMVYIGRTPEQIRTDRINKIKCFLLSLIEEEFEFSFRTQNCLNNSGIKLIGQLVQRSAFQLLNLKNFGRTSLRDIEEGLKEKGLSLDMNLNFFPWNGNENGNELIQILSLQKTGGGFLIDKQAARALCIDLTELNGIVGKKKMSVLHTEYLLNLLQLKYEKDASYLTILIKLHFQWLKNQSM